jgi:structural maintenance of chromosome 2
LKASLSHVCFDYDGPGKSGVIGKIVSLFKLKSDKLVTAIEICAGNRLFNLVVDSVRTAETVLQNKHFLQHRVTMIPLDKISPKVAQANTVSFAKKIGGSENVHIAIDLLDFDGSVRKAMEFVFGNTFICTSAEAAHSVCFHDKIRTRAVTLDGDSYDPSGTLNGGFRGKSESLLSKVLKMHSLHGKLDQVNSDLNQALAELQDFERVCSNRNKIEKTLEISRCKLDQYEKSVEHSRFREIEKELALLKEKLEAARFSKTSACQTKKEAQKRLEELSKIKSGKIDHSCILAGLKDKIEAKSLELQRVKSEYEGEKTRLQDMLSEEQELIRSISELSQSTRSLESQVQEATAAVETITRRCRDCEKDLQKLKDSVVANDSETNDLKKRRMALQKKKNDLLMEGRKIQHKLARYHREFGECAEQVKSLSRQFPWINDVKDRFGVKNTEFDFSRLDFEAAQKSLQDSKSKIEKLSKKVNKKVQVLIERSEADFKNLMERRSIIEGDKVKIEQVIEELERKKNETMETTWKKVNSDFGSIFSTLLPGTTAMLQPPEGQTVLDGLEVKVAFGNVWKESLSELSGGQRSLLALSLILALLRFKPAPMYILDEVDAALDLSHTQNIGRMLKKHFSQSQFIVVSLKEGMFSNANVVFRTKFVDGVSTVARTVNRQ